MTGSGTSASKAGAYADRLMAEIWPRVRGLKPNGVLARPAATLLLIDNTGKEPKVLMGKRNPENKFMPGKFVFPGGQLDPEDKVMPAAGTLAKPVEMRLGKVRGRSNARAIAMAAIRETFEETGLVIGASAEDAGISAPDGSWTAFAEQGLLPNLEAIHFVGRAITPPRLPRRYDTIFLAAEASCITARVEGFIGPDKELVELDWLTFKQAHDIELALITSIILHEVEDRLAAGFSHRLPVPWYSVVHPQGWIRREM